MHSTAARTAVWFIFVALASFPGKAFGAESARYPYAILGVRGATVPSPGFYYTTDEIWYHADKTTDKNGDPLDLDFKIDAVTSLQRFLYVSDFPEKAIGAQYGAYLVTPLYYNSVKMGKLGVDDERYRVGDLMFCPLLLEWHKNRFDIGIAYDLFIPTGDFDRSEAATAGAEYWTHMFSVGGTGYLDKEKTWTFSMIARYETSHERKGTDYTAGDQFHIEWGAAKFIPKWKLDVGLSGYASWQITDDTGRGVWWDRRVHDRVFAAGPEVKWHINPGCFSVALRYHKEFGARDHMEGHITTLNLSKKF
jgi:hypothetical protein